MKPNPDIALIYHYDLARALAGEVVDWQAIPVNVQAGREGGDLCRLAADFGKRRDLFAMPAPIKDNPHYQPEFYKSESAISALSQHKLWGRATELNALAQVVSGEVPVADGYPTSPDTYIAAPVPAPAEAVEQPAVDPQPVTASSPVAVSAAARDKLRARIKQLVAGDIHAEALLRHYWPPAVLTLKHQGHSPEQFDRILAAVRRVESEIGAGWHPDDSPEPRSAKAIRRAVDAWAGRDPGTAWFAASLIATFEQCRNADATFEDLVSQFSIEQADRLHDAAQAAQ